ncbi:MULTISPECIES: PH domain-containing protein [unclassified Rhodococcus (in: high G+C Gram-positive bacteria)]|uniref:PH domain-containing protein n=1 Tax=unclassified Rhodococcus (in: high G+C Gram-positive bacteria) TaxID=192944 RepID=UPI001C9B176D|nr:MULTISPECIES: PH domain-containing protein [unclassified Rhodococcus (in: high G+C Gram-positive bacteria)]MBY6678095.1 PH domain-containing protein [Rhodococcus sp. BP-332]MBY6708123.1 PH domain-containing protein [Rhodococcus sp. BP-241]MDQ1180753.1 membrane protein YdbS with pleckstrin-like domain [Rhodococcus sp. SORGH_AS_0301]MDQ1202089.1 membrane protein YdbS with pleckstrin-like domain [Rhodococcus sp. SORGH_AS_0303]
MSFPQDALGHEEDLILHRHPHWKMLVLPVLTFLVATLLAGFLVGLIGRSLESTARSAALIAVAVVWLGLIAWRTAVPVLRWRSTHFVVTDRRVLVRQGVLSHSGIDIPVRRVSNVQFRHGLLDRLLKTGTLVIVASSDDPLEFDDIPDVERVHSLLYHQVFDSQNHGWDDGDDLGPARTT